LFEKRVQTHREIGDIGGCRTFAIFRCCDHGAWISEKCKTPLQKRVVRQRMSRQMHRLSVCCMRLSDTGSDSRPIADTAISQIWDRSCG
jgi:hypothetical protein